MMGDQHRMHIALPDIRRNCWARTTSLDWFEGHAADQINCHDVRQRWRVLLADREIFEMRDSRNIGHREIVMRVDAHVEDCGHPRLRHHHFGSGVRKVALGHRDGLAWTRLNRKHVGGAQDYRPRREEEPGAQYALDDPFRGIDE